jgi:hypothetical protein
MTKLQKIMITAWKMARESSLRHGGKVRAYFASALRMAWAGQTLPAKDDQKTIASDLDRAAARAGQRGATKKQCWYLAGLLFRAGETAEDVGCGIANFNAVLTGARASHFIDTMLRAA